MDKLLKNGLYIAGGALVVSSIVGFKKYEKVKAIFDVMDIEPESISKFDINIASKTIRFNLDVLLKNNSKEDLFVTGSAFAILKEIDLFYKDFYIATAKVSINEISIPGENQLIIKNIPVVVHAVNILQNITSLIDFKVENLGVIGIIEAFGKTYRIGEE